MGYSVVVMLTQYWPGLLFIAVIGFLVSRGARGRREALIARNVAQARQHDMDYAAPSGNDVAGGVDQGTHRFSGTTRGLAWVAEVVNLTAEADDGQATRRRTSLAYTRWTAFKAATHEGTLLLMTLPDGVHPPPAGTPSEGLLARLASKAAWAALQVYIRGNFGNERASSLSLAPEHRLPLDADEFGSAFVAFGDRPSLLARMPDAARAHLLSARDTRVAFLWDMQGLTLTWQRAHMTPEEVAACAEYGATLADLLGA